MTYVLKQTESVVLVCFGVLLITSFAPIKYTGFASPQNETSITSNSLDSIPGNNMSIVLVHGAVSDGSIWSKVIPILTDAGHRVIAVQLPLHSLGDDIATVERAIELFGGPTTLVGHSYGGEVITNAGYNNSNVTGLVYLAALAPDAGETGNDFFEQLPEVVSQQLLETFSENTVLDSAGFLYLNPTNSTNWLLRMLIRSKLISWQRCKNHLTNLLVWKNRVLQLGGSSHHGIKSLRTIVLFHLIYSGAM